MVNSVDENREDSAEPSYTTVRYGDIDVCWQPELEGGGRGFGQDYLPLVEHLFGHVDRVFELCAGAGCIGFSLLAAGLCDSLALADINPRAVEAASETVRRNGLEDRVSVYAADGLAGVPKHERCDLFVANPPFFLEPNVPFLRDPWVTGEFGLRSLDPGLELHKRLYREIPPFLKPGGSVLLQGCSLGCPPSAFPPLIEASGLEHVETLWYSENQFPFIYYVWSKRNSPNVLPGHDDNVVSVRVELREPPGAAQVLSADGVYLISLANHTGRGMAVRAASEKGSAAPGLSLAEIPPDGELELPQMALPPGAHIVFRDEASKEALAEVRIAERI